MVDKEGLQYQLTTAEKEVFEMITSKFYNLKQIQIIRKCSRQAIYKIRKSLIRKGYLNLSLQKVDKFDGTSQPKANQVRLHGQEFHIKIIWQDQFYQKSLEKSNILYLDGHTIKLSKNSIEIYASEGAIFYGEDEERADKKSIEYWKRFFPKLEHELKIVIFKERSRNIKEVNHHYARGNSELCEKNIEDEGKRIRIYAYEDGKLAFITDESFGGKEDETVHPITAKRDRGAIDKQINDWRLNNPLTNSELAENSLKNSKAISGLIQIADSRKEADIMLMKNQELHFDLLKGIKKELNGLARAVSKIKKENAEIKLGSQKTLKEFI